MTFKNKHFCIILMCLLYFLSLFIFIKILFTQFNINKNQSEIIKNMNEYDNEEIDISKKVVTMNMNFQYATMSIINDGIVNLYINNSYNKKNKINSINAGHGTIQASQYFVYSHPDKSSIYTNSSTQSNINQSLALSLVATYTNGKIEADLNLIVAKFLKDLLLLNGYFVLMIREDDDVNLDNIARTILSNEYADIEISIHFDSGDSGKGFFTVVPLNKIEYKKLETINKTYDECQVLAKNIIYSCKKNKTKVFRSGLFYNDKIQFSYSKIPNVILECGDGLTDMADKNLCKIAEDIYYGIDMYFKDKE